MNVRVLALVGGFSVSAFVTVSLFARHAAVEPGLPFYDSPELTPRWHDVAHRVAPFVMTTQMGESLSSGDLEGRVYVASFIYTRCSVVCPRLVQSLKEVTAAIGDPRLTILSFSVTPDQDPPEVLAEFGRERGIVSARWKLLTGDQAAIYDLARSSFFADDGRLSGTGIENEFLHTEKLVLVDQHGKIRGVYNGSQRFDVEHLISDAGRLLKGR